MPIFFSSLLAQFNVSRDTVILLRHQDTRTGTIRTPYKLWRDNRPAFESYQSLQTFENRSKFTRAPLWASFVATPDDATMFVGMYVSRYKGLLAVDTQQPHRDGVDLAQSCDEYELTLDERFADLEAKLFIEWGGAARAWVQRADSKDKQIVELHAEFKERAFPGYLNFLEPLSQIPLLPPSWVVLLKQATGVYLLTCPKTREQYVGAAYGVEGFWQRWSEYVRTGHGGNIALKSRELSDYRVSILEVAGSGSNGDDIRIIESRWKAKLQSLEMGLNRNR